MKLYDIFSGDELKIAEKIQQRRLQILVHSYIYYELDQNVVSDQQWMQWAQELVQLQNTNPDIAEQVMYADTFRNFDGSSGADLDYRDEYITNIGNKLLTYPEHKKKDIYIIQPAKTIEKTEKKTEKRRLF